MKFSIATSFYNNPPIYVDRIYSQIKPQTYENWEWVVSDDFSDNAGEIKDKLKKLSAKDPKVKYYETTKKKERFWNPQLGCSGEWVVELGSDNYMFPKLLEIYKKLIENNPGIVGLSSNATQYHGDEFSRYGIHDDTTMEWCKGYNYNRPPYSACYKNVIEDYGYEGLKYFQNDTNIVRQLENKGDWLWVPRNLTKYTKREDSISHKSYSKAEIKEIEEERLLIENKLNRKGITYSTKYLPVVNYCRAFTAYPKINEQSGLNLYFWAGDLEPYEKELLKEVFFDHNLVFEPQDNVDMYFFYVDKGSLRRFKEKIKTLKGKPYNLIYAGREINNNEMHQLVNGGWQTGLFALYKQGVL